tara:strand:- start:1813 stop:2454 length:642 start_codon:yes stop_codon:yes gene_type:complete
MKDSRLDLGRYISNPFNKRGHMPKRLDFDDLFSSKASEGQYPWNPSRFGPKDLLKRSQTRKMNLNPDLNFVGNSPFFDGNPDKPTQDYELFEGLGRFNRPFDYDFEEGRPLTRQRPQDQPDFNPQWKEAYDFSPTLSPEKSARNPMPRMANPDPNGYLMQVAESDVENEFEGNKSVSQLLSGSEQRLKKVTQEQEEGKKAIDEAKDSPDKIDK